MGACGSKSTPGTIYVADGANGGDGDDWGDGGDGGDGGASSKKSVNAAPPAVSGSTVGAMKGGELEPTKVRKMSDRQLRRRLTVERDVELDFELGRSLGQGAFSKVVAGRRRSDGLQVAVKILNARALENVRSVYDEIAVLKALRHPNICAIVGAYQKNGSITIVMEMLEGEPLLDHIVELGSYSEALARDSARTLLDALAYMHERGVVHRDLKVLAYSRTKKLGGLFGGLVWVSFGQEGSMRRVRSERVLPFAQEGCSSGGVARQDWALPPFVNSRTKSLTNADDALRSSRRARSFRDHRRPRATTDRRCSRRTSSTPCRSPSRRRPRAARRRRRAPRPRAACSRSSTLASQSGRRRRSATPS